ncbi:MAG: terminase small subunit, partial [Proteobacteria bacterium]|nr:terminase small subunit [Pseudomonadota bacterium]
MSDRLTAKQQIFVDEYVKLSDPSLAYRAAYDAEHMGDAAVRVEANKLLRHPTVTLHLAKLRSALTEKAVVDANWVISGFVENYERAMQIKAVLDKEGKPIGQYVYQGGVANRSLEMIGKTLGIFVDRSETLSLTLTGSMAMTQKEAMAAIEDLPSDELRSLAVAVLGDEDIRARMSEVYQAMRLDQLLAIRNYYDLIRAGKAKVLEGEVYATQDTLDAAARGTDDKPLMIVLRDGEETVIPDEE